MMLFQNLELFPIEALACIILQSRKESSSLAHVTLIMFIKLFANYYHSCITKKNITFPIMNMTMWWEMKSWYEFGGGSIAIELLI
jgi:hypothetical protein